MAVSATHADDFFSSFALEASASLGDPPYVCRWSSPTQWLQVTSVGVRG
jgi:hypothetical protein